MGPAVYAFEVDDRAADGAWVVLASSPRHREQKTETEVSQTRSEIGTGAAEGVFWEREK
jgi:hypothetical protein